MPEIEVQVLERKLIDSANRVVRFLDLGVAPTILSNEIALLLRTALAIYPKEMGGALGDSLGGALRSWCGVCLSCDNDLEDLLNERICKACQLKLEMEMEEESEKEG